MKTIKPLAAIAAILTMALSLAACEAPTESNQDKAASAVSKKVASQKAYIPINDVELDNYNKAQKLYDTPSSIIWCTTTWGNTAAPIVTIPIAGKLTSSSTTYFQPEAFFNRGNYSWQTGTARSVDGLFHPNPPQYRYGFTPGGQYVDFFNMPTLCTTALTKLQRQQTKLQVEVDPEGKTATTAAEKALASGNKAAAQQALSTLEGN